MRVIGAPVDLDLGRGSRIGNAIDVLFGFTTSAATTGGDNAAVW